MSTHTPHSTTSLHHRPPPHILTLKPSPSLRPLSHTLLVKTEFVFHTPDPASSVFLHGDWDNFTLHPLSREQQSLWSVILVVPTGHRQFYFSVDGSFALSPCHPITRCGKRNWRNVHAPRDIRTRETKSAFVEWASERLVALGIVMAPGDDHYAMRAELPVVVGLPQGVGGVWRRLGWGESLLALCSLYFVGAAAFALVFGK